MSIVVRSASVVVRSASIARSVASITLTNNAIKPTAITTIRHTLAVPALHHTRVRQLPTRSLPLRHDTSLRPCQRGVWSVDLAGSVGTNHDTLSRVNIVELLLLRRTPPLAHALDASRTDLRGGYRVFLVLLQLLTAETVPRHLLVQHRLALLHSAVVFGGTPHNTTRVIVDNRFALLANHQTRLCAPQLLQRVALLNELHVLATTHRHFLLLALNTLTPRQLALLTQPATQQLCVEARVLDLIHHHSLGLHEHALQKALLPRRAGHAAQPHRHALHQQHVVVEDKLRRPRQGPVAHHEVLHDVQLLALHRRYRLQDLVAQRHAAHQLEVRLVEDHLQLLLVALQRDGHARLALAVQLVRLRAALRQRGLEVAVLADVHLERLQELVRRHPHHPLHHHLVVDLAVRDEDKLAARRPADRYVRAQVGGVHDDDHGVGIAGAHLLVHEVVQHGRVNDEQEARLQKRGDVRNDRVHRLGLIYE